MKLIPCSWELPKPSDYPIILLHWDDRQIEIEWDKNRVWPRKEKIKYDLYWCPMHDAFYQKYFEKYPEER
jgi:hypothetical protein